MNFAHILSKRDIISFEVSTDIDYSDAFNHPWKHTDIIINDKSLFTRLKEYESFEAQRTSTEESLAGQYVGIDPADLYNIFLKYSGSGFSAWQCAKCRSLYCTSRLICKYTINPFYVEFSDFKQILSPTPLDRNKPTCVDNKDKYKWDYRSFGPFRFNTFKFFSSLKVLSTK